MKERTLIIWTPSIVRESGISEDEDEGIITSTPALLEVWRNRRLELERGGGYDSLKLVNTYCSWRLERR